MKVALTTSFISSISVRVGSLAAAAPRLARTVHENGEKCQKPAATDERRFACAFDSSLEHGRSLKLRFTADGSSAFEEHVPQTKLLAHAASSAFGVTICDVQRVHARDIRKLDSAVLMNADPVRAIIMRDACLVFVPDGADSLLSILRESFRETTSVDQGDSPFEFQALEALLATLSRYFEADYEKRAPVVSTTFDRLAHSRIAASELETLHTLKNTMNEFESQILDNEEDLRLLYLSKLNADPGLLSDLWSFDSEEAKYSISIMVVIGLTSHLVFWRKGIFI
ncbi:hypothetical protein PybrP1_010512 [[Pythium] brassicae (nom. inval.)]|nr:hypothetical protein PybrP1_010512 [[Pythium] brassicae (nom. inval.)]